MKKDNLLLQCVNILQEKEDYHKLFELIVNQNKDYINLMR